MKHTLPMTDIPLRMPVGNHSDGSVVELNLHQVCPLFITHPDKKSWLPFLRTLVTSVYHVPNIHWIVCLDREGIDNLMPELEASGSLETFVPNDPESGTYYNRKQWVRSLMKAVNKRSREGKKKKTDLYICIIDDIWDLIRRSDRSDAKKIQHLIRTSSSSNLRIIAGSSAGHRTLFPELLANKCFSPTQAQSMKQVPPTSTLPGTELIIGTEGLIFSGQPGGHSLEKWYAPIQWLTATVPISKKEIGVTSDQDLKFHPGQTQETLPENAELFSLESEESMPFRQPSS
jgi:hypothetical protein